MGAFTEAVVLGYGKQSCFRDSSEVELKGSGNLHCEDFDTSTSICAGMGRVLPTVKHQTLFVFSVPDV